MRLAYALTTLIVLTVLTPTWWPIFAAEQTIRVFILAGQSNMEGLGNKTTLEAMRADPENTALLKRILNDDGSYIVRNDVFTYYSRNEGLTKAPLQFGQGAWKDFMGPELGFGTVMGDYYNDPVLLIKTAWGGKDLYCDFRPPSAGNPAYVIPGKPREMGVFYQKMIGEIHQCLDHLDTHFPQFKGMPYTISGFVWVQGWNDLCAPREIQQQVYDEYASNFAHLVHDLRAELKLPKLPVVVAEQGVGGEKADNNMIRFRAGQAKIQAQSELSNTLGYVRTAPFWYPELTELPSKRRTEEQRVRKKVIDEVKDELKDKPEASDPKKLEQRVNAALDKALKADEAYQKIKAEHDKHVGHWECHYQGSTRVYMHMGVALGEAMKELLK